MAKITKEQAKAIVAKLKHRKKTEGKVNIEGISAPKKHKPKKVKETKNKTHTPGSVSIGTHGGRYIQEASGHKRYVKDGNLAGSKKLKKALAEVVKQDLIEPFIKSFKKGK